MIGHGIAAHPHAAVASISEAKLIPNIEAGDPRVEKRPADVIGAVRSMEDVVALVDARSAQVSGETLVG
jgi:hypothetical protein